MTEATLSTVDCTPVTENFDVDIVSIDGTQAKITVADGLQEGNVVRWEVTPSNAEVDNWGLRQTQVPPGTIAYLLHGESVEFRPSAVYDYRFQTSDKATQTDLSMYLLFSASQGVIIPPSDDQAAEESQTPGEESALPAPTVAAADDAAQQSTAAEAATTPVIDAASFAQPAETPSATEIITQNNVAIRLAADLSAVIIDTVSAGEVVGVLGDPIEAGNQLWYQVVSGNDVRGWIQSFAFEEAVAESADATESTTGTAAPIAAATVDLQPGDRATVVDPPLNLRAEPHANGEVIASLEVGQLMRIDAAAGSAGGYQWFAVSLLPENGQSGYVAGSFLQEVGLLEGDVVEVGSSDANIRVQPTTSAASLGNMTAGDTGRVIAGPTSADGYDWYLLLLDDQRSGWVAGSLLRLAGNAVDASFETTETAIDPGPTGEAHEPFRTGAWVRVTEPPINLRAEPDPQAVAREALDAGDLLVVLSGPVAAGGYSWYLVDVDGVQGYAAGEYLAGGYIPGEAIQVIDASVYLRSEPGVEGDIVTSLVAGESATVVSPDPLRDGEYLWILVRTVDGQVGYVATEFIEPVAD